MFSVSLYDELRADYKIAIGELTGAAKALNEHIQMWRQTLKQKVLNQFDTTLEVRAISPESFAALTTADTAARNLLVKHNAKTENFAQQTKVSKQKLELHYAATETDAFEYFVKTQTKEAAEPKLQQAEAALVAQEKRIQQLENALSSAGSGALQFNQALHRFLGRSDLSLRFNAASSGYEIIRHDTGAHDCNLSEGEKTAVAFVYFVTKLTENDNKISDTIIVVDDPVSSFDSNHLFHAASYLRVHCKDAKQLFVLTHNFNFFKLMRDWFVTTNTNRKRKNPPKPANAFFFVIQSDSGNPRSSSIQNADKSLIEYQSEYHYLFARLHGYKAHAALSVDDAYLTANLARKLLEAFFSFKYPKGRGGDLAALLSAGQKNCTKTTVDTQERIYRFISKYSHSAYIEVDADTSENLNGESHSVIQAIFDWIEEVDPVHMQEMEEVVA